MLDKLDAEMAVFRKAFNERVACVIRLDWSFTVANI
jgi:hypothetical protein